MIVTFGSIEFDKVQHDAEADVLYLAVDGREAAHWEESPEGHVLRFDADGELMGITIIDVRANLDADSCIAVTVPKREELGLRDLGLAIA